MEINNLHKKIMTLLMSVLYTAITFPQADMDNSISICNNYLFINGQSNVNQFSFKYISDQYRTNKNISNDLEENIEIAIPVKEFEASNPMMYKDFLSLMKESEFPHLHISFSKRQLEKLIKNSNEINTEIKITIAGVSRKYEIQCSIVRCNHNYYLKGKELIRLSDFELKPPEKLLGIVKVNNEINVDFGFIITFTDNNTLVHTP